MIIIIYYSSIILLYPVINYVLLLIVVYYYINKCCNINININGIKLFLLFNVLLSFFFTSFLLNFFIF